MDWWTGRLENCYRNDTAGLLVLLRDTANITFHQHHYLTLIIKVRLNKWKLKSCLVIMKEKG